MPTTTVLPNAELIDPGITFPANHVRMWELARTNGGACTKKFAQGADSAGEFGAEAGLREYFRRHPDGKRWGGMCKGLTLHWIVKHAHDTDFWGWLFKNGAATLTARVAIAESQADYNTRAGDVSDALWAARAFLALGMVEQGAVHNGGSLFKSGVANQKTFFGRSTTAAGLAIAKAMVPATGSSIGRYQTIRIQRSDGGRHVMAAWVERDVAFFDPNFGGYWFETRANFRAWFPEFWAIFYGPDGWNGAWEIRPYGKMVNVAATRARR